MGLLRGDDRDPFHGAQQVGRDIRLVYALTPRLTDGELPWYKRPATLAVIVLGLTAVLNVIFW
jgi:hypothetical protein